MTNAMPSFMPKEIAVPVFATKEQALLADMFRCTATWVEDLDIDVVACVMKNGLPTADPMSLIYQAGSKNPQTRTLRVGEQVIASLFDDDTDGVKGNQSSDTLEAGVYFPKRGLTVGYDSVAFSVLSYNGTALSALRNPAVRVEALQTEGTKYVPIPGVASYDINFAEAGNNTLAVVAIAFQINGNWYFENVTKGISTQSGPKSLEDLWAQAPIILSRAIANYK
jgi:hypothetical protein